MAQERTYFVFFPAIIVFLHHCPLTATPTLTNNSIQITVDADTFNFLLRVQAMDPDFNASITPDIPSFEEVHGPKLVFSPVKFFRRNAALGAGCKPRLDISCQDFLKVLLLCSKYNEEQFGADGKFNPGVKSWLTIWLLRPRYQVKVMPVLLSGNKLEIVSNTSHESAILLSSCPPLLAVITLISSACINLRRLFKKNKPNSPKQASPQASSTSSSVPYRVFQYSSLREATKNFHSSQLLGTGVYASVYRAILPDSGAIYAVKRFNLNDRSKQSKKIEFKAIFPLKHPNILELRGWCDQDFHEPLLVFDCMPNRSLEDVLWSHETLLWPERYKIAIGVAEALRYLHEDRHPAVIHGDIKESNVMLDAEFNPKLGDFGLALCRPPYILQRERTEQDPPECELDAEVTEKIDVYLYGSMVLTLCIRRAELWEEYFNRIRCLKTNGTILEAVFRNLDAKNNGEEIMRVVYAGLECVEKEAQRRPSMAEVLRMMGSAPAVDDAEISSSAEQSV